MYNNAHDNTYQQVPPKNDPPMIRMSPEEEKIYKECTREAFVKKGVPYGAIAAAGAFALIKIGFLKANPTFGYAPTMLTLGSFGTLVGMISHKATCIQKIMDLPDSSLKRQVDASVQKYQYELAKQKGLIPPEPSEQVLSSMIPELQADDYQPPSDFDTFTGVHTDTDQRDDFYTMEPLDKFTGTSTTYDELRKKNREEYVKSQFGRSPPEADHPRPGSQAPFSPPVYQGSSNLPFDRDRVPQYQLND